MSQPTYRMKHTAQRLGTKPSQLGHQLRAMDAITEDERAHPSWVHEGWLTEEHCQYHLGWKWRTRIDIAEPGLAELWGRIQRAACRVRDIWHGKTSASTA